MFTVDVKQQYNNRHVTVLDVYALCGNSVSSLTMTPKQKSCSGTGFCTKKCVQVRGFLLYSTIDASAASNDVSPW